MSMSCKVGRIASGTALLALAACIPPATEPTPAPSPTPTTVAVQPPPPPPPQVRAPVMPFLAENWADQPRTAGDWTYGSNSDGSTARFADGNDRTLLVITCSAQNGTGSGRITITRRAAGLFEASEMEIRTETATRSTNPAVTADGTSAVWSFNAGDRFLEAIAFSRGHFAVGVVGAEAIYPPAWPEITRVIENCR